jgi:hypothetical protein
VKEAYMTSETNPAAESGEASVVLARFDSYRHAEHMLASLGRGFRTKARKGGATAVVVRGNPDGSLKVTESRVLSAAAGSAERSWDGSVTEFLAALDPGSAHDWVRAAVGEPSSTSR